ncbi:hypothetical protein E3P78_03784 [Wallemia ichthyophaga]|nr:hypothetical protein E3P98_03755 [Wallemia ichthyophaga]TIB58858.1 hypothetical protein E3P78_03784 [Wallemia ichthyophaga]
MVQFIIRASNDLKIPIDIDAEKTVLELKHHVQTLNAEYPAERLRLIYSGKVLKDEEQLSKYSIAEGNTVHMVKGAPKSTPSSSSAQPATAAPTPEQNGIPSTLSTGAGAHDSLIEQLGSSRVAGALNSQGIDVTNPNMLQDLMSSPEFSNQMSRMMSDPSMLDQVLNSPQFASLPADRREHMRQTMQSPFFRSMMSNPETIRAMMQAQRAFGGGDGAGGQGFPPPGSLGQQPNAQGEQQQQQQQDPMAGIQNLQNLLGGAGGLGGLGGLGGMGGMGGLGGLGGMGGFGGFGQPSQNTDQRPPEERYETQLSQLTGMGFTDANKNIRALMATGGDINAAVEYLFTNL